MAKAKCPECGEMGECYYREADTSLTRQIFDDYRFICPHCGFEKRETQHGGEVGYGQYLTNCPFCNNDNLHHPGGSLAEEEAEKLAWAAKARAAGFCPACGQRLPEKKG